MPGRALKNSLNAGKRLGMAEIGTPENPEIIEPGERPSPRAAAPALTRWALARQILRVLASLTFPAMGVDLIFVLLAHTAMNYGGVLPWVGMILMILPAFLLTLVTVVANLVLWPALFMILTGRAQTVPNFRWINVRR
jgi:hypothetical protein